VNLSLKLPVIFSLPILFLTLIASASAQENSGPGSIPFSSEPYKIGERLTYNVSFSSFPSAAHIELQVISRGTYFGRDGVQLRAHVETTGVVNVALFAINNDYTTYVDPESGLPYHRQQVVREASKSTEASQDFNQPAGTIAVPSAQRGFTGTYDFVSVFYRLRALPLVEGSSYSFSIRSDTEEYQVDLKVTGKQVVKTNVGSFNALVAQIRVANNSRANSYHLKVYFSDDARHVPVLITAHLSAGEIRAELAGSDFVTPPVASPTPTPPVTVAAAPNPTPLVIPARASDDGPAWPFKVGEQLNYQVFLGDDAPMASANFQVRARSRYFDHDGLLLAVKAQTTGVIQRLFVANDQINSYVDPKALLPFRTEMNLVEGKRRLNQTLSVNQDYGTATTPNGLRIEIPVGTHDYLSFFYAVRTFNLTPPKRNAVSILVNNKPKTLFISSLKRETIQLGSQKIPAIALSLTTDDSQSDKYLLRMWISDDKRRLPLRITGSTEIGPFRADLVILPATIQ
jgi:uncharacterized protein DUF3108